MTATAAQSKYNKYTCGQLDSPAAVSTAQNLIKLLNLLTSQQLRGWNVSIKCSARALEVGKLLTKQTAKAGESSFDPEPSQGLSAKFMQTYARRW